jgi:glycosyltransferase involved in cell wall biosynthesis
MRYIWDLYPQYYTTAGFLTRAAMFVTTPLLRVWDVSTAARVDHFIANSNYVARRIEKYYRRAAYVVHPPVDIDRFNAVNEPGNYYLCAGQITPYKKIEIALQAMTQLNRPLVVIGSGVTDKLRKMAGPTVTFLGSVDDATLAYHFSRCRALIFPGVEDFGIVPIEVMASGRPVIAFARGGALETVVDGLTGIFFHEQTVEALTHAVLEFERRLPGFDPQVIRRSARGFDRVVFSDSIRKFLGEHC